jgi:MerR family transcriptional regulator, copper efflux regulator
MRISEAAKRLGTSARMLRYREDLGLLPQVRDPLPWPSGPGTVPRGAGAPGRPGAVSRGGGAAGGLSAAGGLNAAGGPSHRQFGEVDLEAVAAALELERRYDISPASLAFGLRVLAEPPVRAAVADLGRRLGRIPATPGRALDFEKERALRLLSRG